MCGKCQVDSLQALTREKRGDDIHRRVCPSDNCQTEKTGKISCEKMTINYFIIFPTAVFPGHKIGQLRNNSHRLRSGVAGGVCDNTLERALHLKGEEARS